LFKAIKGEVPRRILTRISIGANPCATLLRSACPFLHGY
jgi:hypothetical protein